MWTKLKKYLSWKWVWMCHLHIYTYMHIYIYIFIYYQTYFLSSANVRMTYTVATVSACIPDPLFRDKHHQPSLWIWCGYLLYYNKTGAKNTFTSFCSMVDYNHFTHSWKLTWIEYQPDSPWAIYRVSFMSISENIYHVQDLCVLSFIRFMEVPPLQSDLSRWKAIEA